MEMAEKMRGCFGFVMGGKFYSYSTPAGDDGTIMNIPPGALSVEGLLLRHAIGDASKDLLHSEDPMVFDFDAIRDKKGDLSVIKLRSLVAKEIRQVEDKEDRREMREEYEDTLGCVERTLKAHGASELTIEVIKAISVGANLKPYGKEPARIPLTVKIKVADICAKQEVIDVFTAIRDGMHSSDKTVRFRGKTAREILSEMVSGTTPIGPLQVLLVFGQARLEPETWEDERVQAQVERIIADTYYAGDIVPAYNLSGKYEGPAINLSHRRKDDPIRREALEFMEEVEWPVFEKDLPARLKDAARVERAARAVEDLDAQLFEIMGSKMYTEEKVENLKGVSFLDDEEVAEMKKAVSFAGNQASGISGYHLRETVRKHAFKTR